MLQDIEDLEHRLEGAEIAAQTRLNMLNQACGLLGQLASSSIATKALKAKAHDFVDRFNGR